MAGNTQIRVATFNIGDFTTASDSAGNSIDYGSGTPKTREEYLEVFNAVGAELWALQEDSEFFSYPECVSPYDAIYKNILPNYERVFTRVYNGKAFLSSFELCEVAPIDYPVTATTYAKDGARYHHPWFLSGKINVGDKEISIVCIHLDWACKERRDAQIRELIKFAKLQEYCIIMGDFNPENRVHNEIQIDTDSVAPDTVNMYKVDWAKFSEEGFSHANGGAFGTYGTIMKNGEPAYPYPWDNIVVTPNIKILRTEVFYRGWMNDHAIIAADLEIV